MPDNNTATPSPPFVIKRTFDAPRELVFKAWTEVERLKEWFGPKGCKIEVANLDLRPGGTFHYCMRTPDGGAMWGKWIYREIVPPERIVLISTFSDEKGGLTRHPMSPTWPAETISTTTLSEENGRTTITIEWSPFNPTPEERATFDSNHPGMTMGWSGTFEQLEEYLKTAR